MAAMHRRWIAFIAAELVMLGGVSSCLPAAANHRNSNVLGVTIAVNAAGDDRIAVFDDTYDRPDPTDYLKLASEVAVALGLPTGSFRTEKDFYNGDAVLADKLATPDGPGRLTYTLDSLELQLVAGR